MNNLLHRSKKFLDRNAPTILTCLGGAGVVATTVLAVKSTPKAMVLLEQAKKEKGEDLTKLEVVKVAGPVYIPAINTGVATVTCIFSANILNKQHQAAIPSAYALLDSSYKDYKKKVEELYGEEAGVQIREELAKDKYADDEITLENSNNVLFYDSFSERYFETTMEAVIKAEYDLNRKLALWGGADLNEFYTMLDIPTTDYGDYIGWSAGYLMESAWESWLDFDHEKVVMDDGLECYILTMSVEPVIDYEYY
jgi:hypothetical protein